MRKDLVLPSFQSSFLSCEKDTELILRKLFIESQPHSDILKRLLVINTKDCLTNKESELYNNIIKNMSLKKLYDKGYIRLSPKIKFPEHEDIKSYILMTFDNFTTCQTNPQFRDCIVSFDIICHTDYWDIGDFQVRPLKIAGYIDGILNNCKLTGIGTFQFLGCTEIILNEDMSGYTLMYAAVHGSDDRIEELPDGTR